MKPGIYSDIPFKEYLEIDAVSNSYLGRLEKCPANALIQEGDTKAMRIGRALHSLVLEGSEGFNRDFAVAPIVNKRTNAGKAELIDFAEANKEKDTIDIEEEELIIAMDHAIRSHPLASSILSEGVVEQTIIWKDRETGILCKGRVDHLPPREKRIAVDVKTTQDASPRGFLNSCVKYGYARQNSFYTDGLNEQFTDNSKMENGVLTEGTDAPYDGFVFVVVEKTVPFRVEVYTLDDAFVERGRLKYKNLLKLHRKYSEEKNFPHYTNEGITVLEAPVYY